MKKVNTSNWVDFVVSDIFETNKKGGKNNVPTGANINKKDLIKGSTPRISVTGINNGVLDYFEDLPNNPNYRTYENFISVSFLGTVFYQKEKSSLDMKVHCLKPLKINLTKNTGNFLVSAIIASLKNVSYSDQISSTLLATLKIKIPVNLMGEPDWHFMENYISNIDERVRNSLSNLDLLKQYKNVSMEHKLWKKIKLIDLFDLSLSKGDNQANKLKEGLIPLVSSGSFNNGICKYVNDGDGISEIFKGNLITIDMFGQPFYQEDNFYAVSHGRINILKPKFNMNKYIAMFLVSIFRKQYIEKYGFTTMCSQKKLKEEFIFLPITNNDEPDWIYMENYIINVCNKVKNNLDCFIF